MGQKIDLTGKRFGRLLVLEEGAKKNGQIYWICQCDCGTIKEIRGSHLRSGKIVSCGCKGKETLNKPIDLRGQKFGRLTPIESAGKRNNVQNLWLCQCDCGNTTIASTAELRNGSRKSCGCINKERFKQLGQNAAKDISNQKFGYLTALYPTDKRLGSHVIWYCQCDCGRYIEVDTSSLTCGYTISCGCIKRSKGELKIETLLQENNISFVEQKSFPDCYDKSKNFPLKFDFFIDNKYLLEFDGEQHYYAHNKGWNNPETLKKVQKRDQIKNDYCKNHNIPLIRIPYTRYNELNLNDLLLETTTFLVN